MERTSKEDSEMKLSCNIAKKNSVRNLIKELERYRDELDTKCEIFVSRLAEVGIQTAKENAGEYGTYIVFRKELEPLQYGCKAIIYAYDKEKIIREWKYQGGTKTAEVSPILMAEFGSGWKAKVLDKVSGVGQGTFPGQTHAFDPHGWWWETPDGERHHSMGEAPTFPMYSASLAMLFDMDRIAKEVFK